MRAISPVELSIAVALASVSAPAVAGPGSTQPGATPIPPGSFLVLREVPARNAIIPGAGQALAVPVAPPDYVFSSVSGVGGALSDSQAASVMASVSPGRGGGIVGAGLDGLFGRQSMSGGAVADHATGSRTGGEIGGAIQSGVAPLQNLFGNLGTGH